MRILYLCLILAVLTGCGIKPMVILNGATHAIGEAHIEGFFTDSQADIVILKVPVEWTPEQVAEFVESQKNR